MFKADFRKRNQIEAFFDITICLFLRDFKSRFGAYRYGLLWMIVEPTVHVVTFIFILSRFQSGEQLELVPFFVVSGVIPFFLFRSITKSVLGSLKGNKTMFSYPLIQPIHLAFSKVVYESFIYTFSFVAIYTVVHFFLWENRHEANFTLLMIIFFLMTLTSGALGLTFMVIREFHPSIEKIVNISFRPMYFLSGAFYSLSVIPHEYLFIFSYNPIVHMIELTRFAVTGEQPIVADMTYLIEVTLLLLIVSLYLYIRNKDKLKSL